MLFLFGQINLTAQTLVCNVSVNVSLDANGEAQLSAEMFLEGTSCPQCLVSVLDENENTVHPSELNPTVNCFDVSQERSYLITDPTTNNSCWGELVVSDPLGACTDLPNVIAISGVCSSINYSLLLNGTDPLEPLTSCLHALPDLMSGTNEISLESASPENGLGGTSTLDLVLMMRGILNGDFTPIQAIVTDIDNDGAVSTIDLVRTRLIILGLVEASEISGFRILNTNDDFSNFNPYDFDPIYESIQFDDSHFDVSNQLNVQIYKLADLNLTFPSDPMFQEIEIDNRSTYNLSFEDISMVSGESYSIEFESNIAELQAMTIGLTSEELTINEITSDQIGQIISNIQDGTIYMSYLSETPSDQFKFTLDITANQSGKLSEFLAIQDQFLNEAVDQSLKTSAMTLRANIGTNVEEALVASFQVYPNPIESTFNISFDPQHAGLTKEVIMRDLNGKIVDRFETSQNVVTRQRDINMLSGLYFIESKIEGVSIINKIIVQ